MEVCRNQTVNMCSNLNVAEKKVVYNRINSYSKICELHVNRIIKSEADIHRKKCHGSSVAMEILILNSKNTQWETTFVWYQSFTKMVTPLQHSTKLNVRVLNE